MIWFRFSLTAIFLAAVIYFQFFFDFGPFLEDVNDVTSTEGSQAATVSPQ